MPAPSDALLFLNSTLKQQTESIQSYIWNDQKVWIKKAGKHNSIWLYRLVGLGARLLGIDALRPVPSLGGEKSILIEAARLTHLASLDVNVPALLANNNQGLMIQDMGTLDNPAEQLDTTLMNDENQSSSFDLFCLTVDNILNTHQKGAWLSEAFIRNILVDADGNIGFIDFETNPHKYLDIAHCFARDWLCFMYSVAIRMEQHDLLHQASEYLKTRISHESQDTQFAIEISCRRLSWLRKLPVDKLGNDGKRLIATATLFHAMQ